MAPTALVDFSLSAVDLAFAVSQQNLNEGLAEYIRGLDAKVEWGFDVDDAGNLSTPKDLNNPNISFSGKLAPPIQPDTGARVWIVDLSKAGAANQVTFNLTFEDGATFTDHQTNRTFTQAAGVGGALWVIPFQVDLTLAALSDTSKVPDSLQERLAILTGDYGHVFDLSQVLLDLETLASTVDPKSVLPVGISLYEWTLILEGTSQYFKGHSSGIFTQEPSAGYVVTHNTKSNVSPKQPLPTYTPTAVDFVIIPSSANNGGASALVFVMMVQSAPMPSAPANAFANVTLIADPDITPGVALVSSSRFIKFIQEDFRVAGIGGAISHYVESIKSESESSGRRVSWQLSANDAQKTTTTMLTPYAANSQAFLNFTMRTKESSFQNDSRFTSESASSTTNSGAQAGFGSWQAGVGYCAVIVSGTMSMVVKYTASTFTSPCYSWTSPLFNWNWSANYAIKSVNASDAQSGGGVQFALQPKESCFPVAPVNAGGGEGGWFMSPPKDQVFITDILAPVIRNLPDTFQNQLNSFSGLGNFVFPGGGTFTFQSPAVNNALCLYTKIQYQNPN
jgi:hypothetical protein